MSLLRQVMRITTPLHARLYRALGSRYVDRLAGSRMPVLLLTTVGRHSAQPRTVVVGFARDGDDLVVLGSNSGLPQAPSWALNLRAHPEAQIEIARQRWPVRGEWMDGPERERLWQLVVGRYPVFRSYQRKTTRPIPVIRLRPTDGPA